MTWMLLQNSYCGGVSVEGSSILDIHTCDNDLYSVQMAVRVWLQDCSTDSEHLHINLPPPSSHHAPPTRQSLTIKCDLHDAILYPLLLPSLTKDFVSDPVKKHNYLITVITF